MLEQAYNKLQILEKKLFVPVTSRTIEQYNRIRFYRDGKKSYYSLVDNGGLLLIDGIESPEWKRDTIELVHDDLLIMKDIFNNLKEFGEIKWQDELVIFMKPFSDESEKKIIILCKENGLLTFNHGSKLYICSKKLNLFYQFAKVFFGFFSFCLQNIDAYHGVGTTRCGNRQRSGNRSQFQRILDVSSA